MSGITLYLLAMAALAGLIVTLFAAVSLGGLILYVSIELGFAFERWMKRRVV